MLRETCIEGDNVSQRTVGPDSDDALGRLAAAMSEFPAFAATAAKDEEGWFYCDIGAGFQRWLGMKSEADLREALSRCGFEQDEIDAMVSSCQDEPWSYCPRQCR